jgi:hypothetical protein
MELTAAGQLRNFTVFPFNSALNKNVETESTANVQLDLVLEKEIFIHLKY